MTIVLCVLLSEIIVTIKSLDYDFVHLLFSMWCCAVWLEGFAEVMEVIPRHWISERCVHWPPGVSATRYMTDMTPIGDSWRKFTLVKIKFTSGILTVFVNTNILYSYLSIKYVN